ncbi:hypothetical protein ACH0AH_04135 [Microbacterium paludicola]|uniref:MFS transporter n=1 Tax=Microbacterium paludicola TaxID=300019 RepID=A0A4Y9FTC6_9MICO|nr:hypothetical protein [Microbacterium paludicola]MBF0817040.1 hypothetical protein [Microbacterium paludicola]TFU32235.1 hypothetical protein E4U02_11495 [Microbacterium paludicola]
MTAEPYAPAAPPVRANTFAIVAICIVGALILLSAASSFLPILSYELQWSYATVSAVVAIVSLVLSLAGAACALLGLRHPRKGLAAIALGYCMFVLIQQALWAGVYPTVVQLFSR